MIGFLIFYEIFSIVFVIGTVIVHSKLNKNAWAYIVNIVLAPILFPIKLGMSVIAQLSPVNRQIPR